MKVIQKNKLLNNKIRHDDAKWSIWNDIIPIDDSKSVIFNTLTRNSIITNNDVLDDFRKLNKQEKEELIQLGILVGEEDDEERCSWVQSFIAGKNDYSYIDLTILVTNSCQMKCVYCFEGEKRNVFLSEYVENSIIDFLRTKAGVCRKVRVTWFGGEPMLAYKIIERLSLKLIQFCNQENIEYTADITTNGHALNTNRIHNMVENLCIKRYIITIDGPMRIHDIRRPLCNGEGSFSGIWNNVNDLVEAGGSVIVRVTVDKQNVDYVPELLDKIAHSSLYRKIGLSFCRTVDLNFTPHSIKSSLFSELEFKEVEWNLIQYAHKLGMWRYRFPHSAPTGGCLRRGDITINPDGIIYKCLDTVGDNRWIVGTVGNLASDKEECPKWLKEWLDWTPLKNTVCKNCVLIPLCNGGCPHNALFRDKRHGSASSCPDWKNNYRRQIKQLIYEDYDAETI